MSNADLCTKARDQETNKQVCAYIAWLILFTHFLLICLRLGVRDDDEEVYVDDDEGDEGDTDDDFQDENSVQSAENIVLQK